MSSNRLSPKPPLPRLSRRVTTSPSSSPSATNQSLPEGPGAQQTHRSDSTDHPSPQADRGMIINTGSRPRRGFSGSPPLRPRMSADAVPPITRQSSPSPQALQFPTNISSSAEEESSRRGLDDWKKRTDHLAAAVLAAARISRSPSTQSNADINSKQGANENDSRVVGDADAAACTAVPQTEMAGSQIAIPAGQEYLRKELASYGQENQDSNSACELHYHETSLSESTSSNEGECKVQLTSVLARAGVGIIFSLTSSKILVHGILKNGGASRASRVPEVGDALLMIQDEPCYANTLQDLDAHFDRHKNVKSVSLTLEDSHGSRYTSTCEKSHPDIHVKHVDFDFGPKHNDLQLIESRIMGHTSDSKLSEASQSHSFASHAMVQTWQACSNTADNISRIDDILFRERLLQEDLKLYHERAMRRYAWEHEERIRLETERDMLLRRNMEFKTRYKSARGRLSGLENRIQDLELKYKEAVGKLHTLHNPFSVAGMVVETGGHVTKHTIAPELSDDENADHIEANENLPVDNLPGIGDELVSSDERSTMTELVASMADGPRDDMPTPHFMGPGSTGVGKFAGAYF
ncbi:hypothetical protein GUITHDRAFT_163123 [Guillardia theta CCMP2712]|uniref:PDZ domain-containing protein n=2 Tax=Guillardia theta TaxID=55529 RepID=L1JCA7_GUITC|nr:hypothetical protein GUITHDRAFT_163123 [Guillardia theta CCMP2712]EKX46156.1 hypothetical protein GUITHDRAFT_163123 [Guillardia theta CCMP2712]|mmetsp:Transcript_28232/g.91447  ORF Transcript_28232/g.91447 Transcript_28232/m.91447 type:complete len:580 (+) Transcript_28232:90-1829(+)|eukprot:XP_005833136.1 hypothetical protein GUITHDRAFT_163123 [Guillardia theta CCMP2712]